MFRRFITKSGWLALVILAVAAGFGGVALQQRSRAAALDDHGVAAVATVEGMRTETHRRRSSGGGTTTETDHLVTYAFRARRADGAWLPLRIEREVPEFI